MTFTEFRLAARRSFLQPLWLQRLCSDFATSLRITLFLCDIFIFSLVSAWFLLYIPVSVA